MRISPFLAALLIGVAGCSPQSGSDAGSEPAYADVDLQGHRGARGLVPENSIPSFNRALELGVQTLEMDVVVTVDSQVVVSHEPWLSSHICSTPEGEPIDAETERQYNIFQMRYSEVARYDCGSRGHAQFPEQEPRAVYKPLLDSALVAADRHADALGRPRPNYNVEIKSRPAYDDTFTPAPPAFARLVYGILERQDALDRATVQSFDPRALQAMRQIDPNVPLAFLVDDELGLSAHLDRLGFTPEIYSPHQRLVDAELVQRVHDRGMHIIPWTVNDPDAMQRLLDLGVDGLITDYPDRAAALLARPSP